MSARLAAAVGFLVVAIAVTSWGLTSAGNASAHHVRRPHASVSPAARKVTLASIMPHAWKPKFNLSFTGTSLDTKIWDTCFPWFPDFSVGCSHFGGTQEYEWYLPSQDRVSNGLLELVAQRLPTLGQNKDTSPHHYNCRSGMVTTYRSVRLEYGAVQVVAQMPAVRGMWPALWLLAVNSTQYKPPLFPPEIDIVEHWGRPTPYRTGVFLHTKNGPGAYTFVHGVDPTRGFHTFTMVWTAHRIEWLIDGKIALVTYKGVPHVPMFFIANLADFRPPKNGSCGGAFLIKSVKIWGPSHAAG